jgi:hypothetical protein
VINTTAVESAERTRVATKGRARGRLVRRNPQRHLPSVCHQLKRGTQGPRRDILRRTSLSRTRPLVATRVRSPLSTAVVLTEGCDRSQAPQK